MLKITNVTFVFTLSLSSFQLLGCIHVLTGPDHLSALAALSANVESHSSFWFGVRWGIGHSTGLILIASIFIIISFRCNSDNNDDNNETIRIPETVTNLFDSFVGLFMICLGYRAIRKAFRGNSIGISTCPMASTIVASHKDGYEPIQLGHMEEGKSIVASSENSSYEKQSYGSMVTGADKGEDAPLVEHKSQFSSPTLSFFAGIVHGLAGPGGVLGVVPAVQLHDAKLSAIYLVSFSLSSTIAMGIFATIFGGCSSTLSKKTGNQGAFVIEVISSSVCILVGITWLTLSLLGKLDDIFP